MKRMIAFFIVVISLFGIKIFTENNLPNCNFEKLVVVSSSDSLFEGEKLKNGNHFYYTFNYQQGRGVLNDLKASQIEGVVFYYDNSINVEELLNTLDFYFKSKVQIEGIEIFYGYDGDYTDFRYIDGKKINVQVVINSTNIVMGYPLILCGY